MKKKNHKNNDDVIVLTHNPMNVCMIPSSRFAGKMKELYDEYDVDRLLFQVGTSTPTYVPVQRENALKKFEPFRIKYNLVVTSTGHNQITRVNNILYQPTKMAPMEVSVNTYPEFVSLLVSISRLYLIAMLTTKYETYNDINTDFEIYNKMLVVGSIQIEKGNQRIISPTDIHYKLGEVIQFFAGALDIKEERLLKHTTSRLFQKDSEKALHISLDQQMWGAIPYERPIRYTENYRTGDDMIGIGGLYSSGIIFLHTHEMRLLNILGDVRGELKLCIYEQSGYDDFPELDRPLTVDDITSHPEEFYVDSLCTNSLLTMDDIISAVSIIHEIAMSQSIILESIGITNAEFIIDIDVICNQRGVRGTYTYYSEDLTGDTTKDLVSDFIGQLTETFFSNLDNVEEQIVREAYELGIKEG